MPDRFSIVSYHGPRMQLRAHKFMRQSLSPLTGGFLLLALIYLMEYATGVSGSVAYVLTLLLILWFSWSKVQAAWIGAVTTVLMVAGFFMIDHNTDPAIAINRALSVTTIWLAVYFTNRFRRLSEAETVQKRQLQALFENATEGIVFTNEKGEIVRINPAAEKMFDYLPGELLGRKIEVLVPEKHTNAHMAERMRLMERPNNKPKGAGRELPARRKDGSAFHAEVALSLFYERDEVYYIAFIVDISERKRQQQIIETNVESIKRLNAALDAKVRVRTAELESANLKLTTEVMERKEVEQRLLKSQLLHSAVARNFPDGIIGVLGREMKYVLADGQELDFIHSNPRGQHLFGPEHADQNDYAERMMETVFQGSNVSFDVDLKTRIYNVTAVPLPDAMGQINEALVVMKNITNRKLAEQKLVKAIEKEKQLSALKSRFVAMASHEFRTPLSTMLSSVFLLRNYNGEKYEANKKTHLDRITRSIQTLTELMNDFLSIGKLEEGHLKAVYSRVEIDSFLRETITELNCILKRSQQMHFYYTGDETPVLTDRQMLTNIMRNLVSNAVKYSPEGSEINVRASVADGVLEILVEDEGMGIPEQEQPEIFKRFYRAENATNIQGTGLGLNIVKKYVNILKGNITFQSRVNDGTVFTVQLPVRAAHELHEHVSNP